jgi:diazepam-binding inhibitor (GABA receptor modulating acyl-CoA-binding protein)
MSDMEAEFRSAAEEVHDLPERPSNEELLELYALFKQATAGDVEGKRPGLMDFKGRAKYDAWASVEGMGRDEAMRTYIALVRRLAETRVGA